jgi:integrase
MEAASERGREMAEIANMLVAAGKSGDVNAIVQKVGEAENSAKLALIRALARRLCDGAYESTPARLRLPPDMTFREFGGAWADGELHKIWPDHIDIKRSAADDLWRMKKHIFPTIGHIPVRDITLDHVDDVMSRLPRTLSKATRRHVAQIIVRLMRLAAYPTRLRASSPIPTGWLPKLGKKKKKQYPILWASEDLALLRERSIPLERRLTFGILHREGLRRGDLACLRWRQLDLDNGTMRIESDKTNHSRMFVLNVGVTAALRRYKQLKGPTGENELVLVNARGKLPDMDHLAALLRKDLQKVGVSRSELFEAHGNWGRLNAHTLRHSFVTRSLARGVPEDAVRQRTGHISNELRRYREAAQSLAELHLDDLVPLDQAIPELAGVGQKVGQTLAHVEKRVEIFAQKIDDKSRLLN